MENNYDFCKCVNHSTFMQITDKGEYFEVLMKSIIEYAGKNTVFKDIRGNTIPTFKYIVHFLKSSL